MNHTKGPWIAKLGAFDFSNDGSRPIMADEARDGEYGRIAMVDSVIERKRKTEYDAPDEVRDANARLIAAAPDMLTALLQLNERHDLHRGEPLPVPFVNAMKAAIDKTLSA